ncbi:hypothetical protein VPNG_00929 [Cytospora leucostoma]|uniref:non-specific serine/threonine protein kinase n=1 Tax=Cytospora leucostoma TaxID=1230097 RepID=A0A423XM40_9PEZI|nr:hypothetical protein VPNG_00929 [Cytospora leucostoma]
MIDRSQYSIGVPAEDLEQYCPGGFHPTYLGDTLNGGQYEIVHKLGFGSYSTVWLAQDHKNRINVAVKIVVARKSEEHNHELKILRHLRETGDPDHPGHRHVSHPLDSFYHEGPNGRHLCVVMEWLGLQTSAVAELYDEYRLDGELARRVSRQALLAVDYLHSCGVAHADIHMGNILFRRSEAERSSSLDQIIEVLGEPSKGGVARKDGSPLEKGVPEYLVEPAEAECLVDFEQLDEVQLVDFGESFYISNPPKMINTPVSFYPPELVFKRKLTEAVDIWNLGSTTYELVIGRPAFEAFLDEYSLIPQFRKVIGGVPEDWISDAFSSGVLTEEPDESNADGFEPLEEQIQRDYCRDGESGGTPPLSEEDLQLLGHYLRRMLVVHAEQRAGAKDLLTEPWVSDCRERAVDVAEADALP